MSFVIELPVRFADVDPAGIVFYPRYFEMLNAALEDWFGIVVGAPFATLHLKRGLGTPTVRLEVNFVVASRLGDRLSISIEVDRVGGSSCGLRYTVRCAGEVRLTATATIVCMDLDAGRAVPWPDDLRTGMIAELEAA